MREASIGAKKVFDALFPLLVEPILGLAENQPTNHQNITIKLKVSQNNVILVIHVGAIITLKIIGIFFVLFRLL